MKEVIKERQGLYRQELNMITAVSVQLSISKAKIHDTVANALRIVENLDHRAGKDAEGKKVMALVSSFRFPINFLRKHVKKRESKSARKENMVLASSFSTARDQTCPGKKMFEIIVEKRDWSSLAGEKFGSSGGSWT